MAFGGSINTDNLSDDTFNSLCQNCEQKGEIKAAERYCLQCNSCYCTTCAKDHAEHRILDSRGNLPLNQTVQTETTPPVSIDMKEPCDKHRNQYVNMYCRNHDDIGCHSCMEADHRSCQDIIFIQDIAHDATDDLETPDMYQTLTTMAKNLELHHEVFQFEKEQLNKKKANSIKNIKQFRKAINERLDALEESSIAEIEEKYNNLINEIDEKMKILKNNKVAVTSAREKLTSRGDIAQKFANIKRAKTLARNATKLIKDELSEIKEVDVEFVPDKKIRTLSEELHALGKVIQRQIKNTEVIPIVNANMLSLKMFFGTGGARQKDNLLKVQRGQKNLVFIEEEDECLCEIISACALKDGTIILSDYNNRRLKCLNRQTYALTDYCNLPGKPWGVCTTDTHEVAVCMTTDKEILFISTNNLISTHKISTDFECWGLTFANENLYVTDFNTSVYIYSPSGRKLKKFVVDQSSSPVFSMICSLNVNETGSRIYVTDDKNGLIVFDNNGKIVRKFNDSCLKSAHGSFLTNTGTLLVCGCSSKNLLQFGPDGDLVGEVLDFRNIRSSYCKMVCCNYQMSKMIVGITENDIQVYDII